MAYVECLLCAGHGTEPHEESQEGGTLIPAAWLGLCVPRWCPGAVVGAKRECHELAVGPSGLGGLPGGDSPPERPAGPFQVRDSGSKDMEVGEPYHVWILR